MRQDRQDSGLERARPGRVLRFARHCRAVSALVLSGVFRNRSPEALERRIAMLPVGRQVMVTGAVLGFLLAAALVAAQFGPLGLAGYFVAVLLLVR